MASSDKGHRKTEEDVSESRVIADKTGKFKFGNAEILALVVIGILALVLVYNASRISGISTSIGSSGSTGSSGVILPSVSASEIMPTGVPAVYGKELSIRYDDISASNSQATDSTMGILARYDEGITLTGDDLARYVTIGSMIACEYCCGATSLVFKNGGAACGCAHSYAMRGLAKYLIKNHGSEYTDDQILEELGKWKVLFFPGVHEQKAAVLKSQGIELNYINLASNKYRGIETGQASGGSMVGGC